MVVVALEQVAAADVQRGRLASQARPALEDVHAMPGLRQAQRAGQTGHAGPQHGDPHARAAASPRRPP